MAKFLGVGEKKGLDFSRARTKAFTVIYEGSQEEQVKNFFRRTLAEAKKIPGVHVGISDIGKIY